MKTSEIFRENAENVGAQLAEAEPRLLILRLISGTNAWKRRWRALAEEQEWLGRGEVPPPVRIAAPAHNTRFPTK